MFDEAIQMGGAVEASKLRPGTGSLAQPSFGATMTAAFQCCRPACHASGAPKPAGR